MENQIDDENEEDKCYICLDNQFYLLNNYELCNCKDKSIKICTECKVKVYLMNLSYKCSMCTREYKDYNLSIYYIILNILQYHFIISENIINEIKYVINETPNNTSKNEIIKTIIHRVNNLIDKPVITFKQKILYKTEEIISKFIPHLMFVIFNPFSGLLYWAIDKIYPLYDDQKNKL
jgi:hypothetical protein